MRIRETASCQVTTPICQPVSSDSGLSGVILGDPNNEGAPEISGEARVGQLLSASAGFWRSPAPLGLAYQWIRCDAAGSACSQLVGATGPEFRPGPREVGARLRVVVSASNSRPRSAESVSAPTPAVAAAPARKPPRRGVRLLSPFPRIVIAGLLTDGVVELTEFTVRGPRGATMQVRCRGRRCPFGSRRARLRATRVRIRWLERRWLPGQMLEVTISRRGFVGKFSRFRIRRDRAPARQDLCLAPAARKPTRCPRT